MTDLRTIIERIVRPYVGSGETENVDRINLSGAEVIVGGDAVASVALALHEMATNAAKYGALSNPDGTIAISWSTKGGRVMLLWVERGGPIINGPPESEGFGSTLALGSVTGLLDGTIDYRWDKEGLTIEMSMLREHLQSPAV